MPQSHQVHFVKMVDSSATTTPSFHVRSISMPSKDHPLMLQVEEELKKLRSFAAQSSLTANMICEGMQGLGGLYERIEELLHLPSSNQLFSNLQKKKWAEVELDGSVRVLDLLSIMRDCVVTMKEHVRDVEISLRRRGETVPPSKMQAQVHFNKKGEKDVKNCFRLLKQMDDNYVLCCMENTEQWVVIKTLKEAREITTTLIQSIFNFLSMSQPKTKSSRWSLISKALHKRKVASEIDANDGKVQKAQDQLQTLQNSIEDIEAGLEFLFRRLIQNRVSLLNILSL